MIGIIISGHGHFANGLASSIQMIAGKQEYFISIDFEENIEKLEKELTLALETCKELTGTLIFCDLVGGSPFKTAILLSQNYTHVEIIAGVNLPMLTEIVLARKRIEDINLLVELALNTGKEQILRFSMQELFIRKEFEQSTGI